MSEVRHSYDVDQVRERTDLLALIGQFVALKKRGGRYTGLCPFHQEKTPSFSVDPEKGFWKCFGCGKGGDAFTFLMQLERLTFPEALERLAERAGVQPAVTSYDAPKRKEERDFLFEVNAAAAAAFHKALLGTAGTAARDYLQRRGISAAFAERFGLGYAPGGWEALVKHLRGRGFSLEVLGKAGLALARSSGAGYIDRFRNRLMIPIHDRQGRVVAFGGRALVAEDNPKYLNTAETPVFHKSRTLYLLHLAVEGIKKTNRVIVTEGYFDAIACHLAGFTEAVATLGTALSEEHAQLLHRLAERVFLVFDADSAGINAALRSQAIFRQAGADVRIVRLPAGHDPDTLLREGGTAAFEQCLASALSPVEFELERLIGEHPARDVESRVRLFRGAAQVLHPLPRLERAEYALWLIDHWLGGTQGNVSELQQAILGEIAVLDRPVARHKSAPSSDDAPPQDEYYVPEAPLEREILTAMIQDSAYAQLAVARTRPEYFQHPGYRRILLALQRLAAAGQPLDIRRISGDEFLTSLIATLAVRESLPMEHLPKEQMLERLQEEHELRQHIPREIALEDRAAAEAFSARQLERSRRAARRGGFEEQQ